MKQFICILVISALLCSCAEVPENLQNESRAKNNSPVVEHGVENFVFDKLPLSEINSDAAATINKSYTQFEFAPRVSVSVPENIDLYDFKQVENYNSDPGAVMEHFFDSTTVASHEFSINDDAGLDMQNYAIFNEEGKLYGAVGGNGFISFLKPSAYSNSFAPGKKLKVYDLLSDGNFSDSYQLADKSVTVQEAADTALKWLEESYASLEPEYKFRITTVIVRETELGEIKLDIYAEKLLGDIPLNSLCFDKDTETHRVIGTTSVIYMQMFRSDEIGSLTNGTGMLIPEKGEQILEIIPLSEVMNYIEATFTDFNSKETISSVKLIYTMQPIYTKDDPESDYLQVYYDEGMEFKGNLVWQLALDFPENIIEKNPELADSGNIKKYIQVDALTGEMHFEFDLNALIQ